MGAVEVLKRYPRGVFTAMGLRFGENTMYYLVVTFSITYLKVHVHANTKAILWWLLAAHAVHFVVIPLAGRLSDRFGRRPIYFVGAVCACTWGFFAFPMMDSGRNAIIMSAVVIGLVFHGLMYAVQPATMAEMFPTRMRYSGVSLGYQVTSIVAGFARTDHRRSPARDLQVLGAHRLVSGGHRGGERSGRGGRPRDQGHRPGGHRPRRLPAWRHQRPRHGRRTDPNRRELVEDAV